MAGLSSHPGHTTGSIFGTSTLTHSSQCQNPPLSLPPKYIQPWPLTLLLIQTGYTITTVPWMMKMVPNYTCLPIAPLPYPSLFAHSSGVNHQHEKKDNILQNEARLSFLWLALHHLEPGSLCSPWSSFPAGLTCLLPFLPPSRQTTASGAGVHSTSSWKVLP